MKAVIQAVETYGFYWAKVYDGDKLLRQEAVLGGEFTRGGLPMKAAKRANKEAARLTKARAILEHE